MPKILSLDLEATGLDTENDRIIELAYVLWDTEKNSPLIMESHFVYDVENYPSLSAEITQITGIDYKMLLSFGKPPCDAFSQLSTVITKHLPSFVVAHNAHAFDKPMLMAELARAGFEDHPISKAEWIDTMYDVPYKEDEGMRKKLKYVAIDHGIVNSFPHRALFDCLIVCQILAKYDFDKILEWKNKPMVVIGAKIKYEQKEEAKSRGFRWQELRNKIYQGRWVKRVEALPLERLQEDYPFVIEVME